MDHPEVFQKFLIAIGKVLVRGFGARKLRLPSPAGYSPRAQDRRLRRRQVHRDAIHVPEVRTVDVFGFDACALVQRHLENGSRTDRKSVVEGKSVSVRVDLGGRRIIKKKTQEQQSHVTPIEKTQL